MKHSIFFVFLMLSFNVLGHGENKPGPHGGHIRMPGAFHTELVLNKERAQVYLLDMAFKNPITQDSQVALTLQGKGKPVKLDCASKKEYFECQLPVSFSRFSSLQIKAQRKGAKGKEAHYPLPLKPFEVPKVPEEDHSHHHHH